MCMCVCSYNDNYISHLYICKLLWCKIEISTASWVIESTASTVWFLGIHCQFKWSLVELWCTMHKHVQSLISKKLELLNHAGYKNNECLHVIEMAHLCGDHLVTSSHCAKIVCQMLFVVDNFCNVGLCAADFVICISVSFIPRYLGLL